MNAQDSVEMKAVLADERDALRRLDAKAVMSARGAEREMRTRRARRRASRPRC